jgi:predicted amidohydrolase
MKAAMQVALIQPDLAWEQPERNIAVLGSLLDQVPPADVVVLPEMWTTGFSMQPERFAAFNRETALPTMGLWAQQRGAAVVGTLIWKEGGRYFNRLWWVSPDGQTQYYDKRHLFALAGEDRYYSPGNTRAVIEYQGWRFLPQVCYDLRFPAWSRNTPDLNYDVALYPANWPDQRMAAWQALLPARAIENMAYVLGVNRTGVDGGGKLHTGYSAAYDYLGVPLAPPLQGPGSQRVVLEHKALTEARAHLGFLKDADLISFPQISPFGKSGGIG